MVIKQTVLLFLLSSSALAHGINGHIHVTAWAAAQVEGDVAELLADPEVYEAYLFGAAFPDSGYAIDDAYSELVHWEPFVEAFIRHVRMTTAPPYIGIEDRKKVAFLLGVGAHGLQDEIFDTLFLPQVEARDDAGQEETDPGTDAFLYTDGHLEHTPGVYAPLDDVITVLESEYGHTVEPGTMSGGMNRVKAFVIDSLPAFAGDLDDMLRPEMPWGSRHYMDETVPGSLASEVPATAAYVEALWRRLNGDLPVSARIVHRYPGRDRTNAEDALIPADSWITLVFGVGVRVGSLRQDTVRLLDPERAPIPCEVGYQRWGSQEDSTTRIVVLRPGQRVRNLAAYTVEIGAGVEIVDGERVDAPWDYPITEAPPTLEAGQADNADQGQINAEATNQGGCALVAGATGSSGRSQAALVFIALCMCRSRRRASQGSLEAEK
mgnify:CR=1 FL=1